MLGTQLKAEVDAVGLPPQQALLVASAMVLVGLWFVRALPGEPQAEDSAPAVAAA